MPAFEHAVELGYRYLETDVHLTADGVLVAFHDADLRRLCDLEGTVEEHRWEQLADVRVGGSAAIPRLVDLFERFPAARFNIDAKSDAAVEPLLDLIEQHDALDRVCLASFSRRRLARMRARFGERLLTNLAPHEVASLRGVGRLPGRLPRAAQVPVRARGVTVVTPRFVRAAHRLGVQVHVWTVDDREEMHRLLELGVDGIMTDRADVLRAVLEARGVWHE